MYVAKAEGDPRQGPRTAGRREGEGTVPWASQLWCRIEFMQRSKSQPAVSRPRAWEMGGWKWAGAGRMPNVGQHAFSSTSGELLNGQLGALGGIAACSL